MANLKERMMHVLRLVQHDLAAGRENSTNDLYLWDAKDELTFASIGTLPRRYWSKAAQLAVQATGADIVIHASEAWRATEDIRHPTGVAPSQREDREEGIIVEGKTRSGEVITMWCHMDRDAEGKPVFREPDLMDDKESRAKSRVMDGLFGM